MVGLNTPPEVLCSLIEAYCLPVLVYGAETINLCSRVLNALEKTYSLAFMKLFKKFNKNI